MKLIRLRAGSKENECHPANIRVGLGMNLMNNFMIIFLHLLFWLVYFADMRKHYNNQDQVRGFTILSMVLKRKRSYSWFDKHTVIQHGHDKGVWIRFAIDRRFFGKYSSLNLFGRIKKNAPQAT